VLLAGWSSASGKRMGNYKKEGKLSEPGLQRKGTVYCRPRWHGRKASALLRLSPSHMGESMMNVIRLVITVVFGFLWCGSTTTLEPASNIS